MSLPLVSIIIPVHNTGQHARKLIGQLLQDHYPNKEIIVIDDGSSDDSWQVLELISQQNQQVRVFKQPNAGASSARNHGITKAKGSYLFFIDSDDLTHPDFINELIEATTQPEVVLALSNIERYNLNTDKSQIIYHGPMRNKRAGEPFKTYILKSLIKDGRMYPVVNKVFDASVIHKFDLKFDEKLEFAEDTRFVLDYLSHVSGQIRFIDEPLYKYNFGVATSTVKRTSVDWRNWQTSYDYLKQWVGNTHSIQQKVLLLILLNRWRISYWRALSRAKAT